MKNLIIAFVLSMLSLSAVAEQALSKSLIENYTKTINDIDGIVKANPEIEKQMQDLMAHGKEAALAKVKSLPIYPKLKASIESAGFDNFEEYYDLGMRIMGAVFKTQMKAMPEGMDMDSFASQMKNQIAELKKRGMPEKMLKEMEQQYQDQVKSMAFMKKAAENVSAADLKFAQENIEWITKVMTPKG